MKFERMALAFFEAGNDLQSLRLVIDDTLEEISAEISRIESLPVEARKELIAEHDRLRILRHNINHTRIVLSSFRALCNVRIDECSPGIQRRMADRVRSAFEASERAARGEPA